MKSFLYILIFFTAILSSCNKDEESNLPSAEERKKEAIDNLINELTSPVNGWKIEYRPNSDNGAYLILLDFKDDGTVTVHSDVVDDDGGDFFEQELRYRIDASLNIDLVLETYGVFHYLFEQQRATFGGEFVFVFLEEDSGNLLFASKTDIIDKTILEFTPAQGGDISLISTSISQNLKQYSDLSPQIFGGLASIQQVVVTDKEISIFWSIDFLTRTIEVDVAGEGGTLDEVLSKNNYVEVNHIAGYTIQNEKLILDEAFSFTLNGENINVSEISLIDFNTETNSFCPSESVEFPLYTGSIPDLGPVSVKKSLFSSDGLNFIPMAETPYSVNALFVFDESRNSLFENGSIADKFPDASSFIFNYGLDDENEPSNAVGFIISVESEPSKTYLRELSSVVREGNKLVLELANSFYYSEPPNTSDEQYLIDITNEIFEGGVIYIFDLPIEDLTVFWLYNPCNKYEFLMVQ